MDYSTWGCKESDTTEQLTCSLSYTHTHTHTHTHIYETFFIFFIHSSAEGDFSCFYILTMVNNSAVNIAVHISFQISIFVLLVYIPQSEIAVLYIAVLCLTFERNSYCLPWWLHKFTIPPAVYSYKGSNFFISLSTLIIS